MPKYYPRLPERQFLYTLDQVAMILEVEEKSISRILWYRDRDPGPKPPDKMAAVNIMPEGEKPEWRVPESSLKMWFKSKGIRLSRRGER